MKVRCSKYKECNLKTDEGKPCPHKRIHEKSFKMGCGIGYCSDRSTSYFGKCKSIKRGVHD